MCLEEKFTILQSESEVKNKRQYLKNQFEALNSPNSDSKKKLSDFKSALIIFLKIAKEGTFKNKSIEEIRTTITRIMSDKRKRKYLRKTRRRRVVTRMTNKLSLLENLIFQIINQDPSLGFTQIELTKHTSNELTNLLVENRNEENLRQLVEDNKNNYTEDNVNENLVQEEKVKMKEALQLKRLTSKKRKEKKSKMIRTLYHNKIRPLMYLFPNANTLNFKRTDTEIEQSTLKKKKKGSKSHTNMPYLSDDSRGNSRESTIRKTMQEIRKLELEDTDQKNYGEKMKNLYKKISSQIFLTEEQIDSKNTLLSRIENTLTSPRLINNASPILKSRVEKQRETISKKSKNKKFFQKSAFLRKYVSNEKLVKKRKKNRKFLEYKNSNFGQSSVFKTLGSCITKESKILTERYTSSKKQKRNISLSRSRRAR